MQDNAWMDQHKMIDWVEKVVKPWGLSSPEGIVPSSKIMLACAHASTIKECTLGSSVASIT